MKRCVADGLTDCDDPECCSSSECSREAVCAAVPAPVDVLLRLPAVQNANFYQVWLALVTI